MNDHFLIDQVLAGNKNAFRFIVLRYQRPIFKFLYTFNLEAQVVEEIAQDTFFQAFKKLNTYNKDLSSFSSWLFTIAKNAALNSKSKHKLRQGHLEVLKIEGSTTKTEKNAEDLLVENSKKILLTSAINQLPATFRSAVIMSYFEELSLEDIAQIESCNLGTVKSRIFRGKELLKKILNQASEV